MRNRLTEIFVQKAKAPGRYSDGEGLHLFIDGRGGKSWVLRTVVQGVRRDIGLGGTSVLSLADARTEANRLRSIARNGGDPIAQRKAERITSVAPTFAEVAAEVHEKYKATWTNGKHTDQWINTLRIYAYPHIGERPVDTITKADVLKVLTPIWAEKSETARRVRQRLGVIFDWANAHEYRSGDSPMSGIELGLAGSRDEVEHHAAVPYSDVPSFVRAVWDGRATTSVKCAVEFLILTASRTKPVRLAEWSEINWDTREWHIPAKHMKGKKPFVIPLTERAIELLNKAKALGSGHGLIFHGPGFKVLSENAILVRTKATCEEMGIPPATGHGFRSSFKDWCREQTNYEDDVSEISLAHFDKDSTRKAYARSDMRDKRRAQLAEWADHVTGKAKVG